MPLECSGEAYLRQIDLQNAAVVRDIFRAGAKANFAAPCRVGSIDRIEAPGRLIATGDLHDNPLHLARLVKAAGLEEAQTGVRSHLVLHEIIHSDRLVNEMDFSYRMLCRVAALKVDYPALVHTLLANHELSQVLGAGIIKDGVKVVEVFNEALDYTFGDEAPSVAEAIGEFIFSMPLALRCVCGSPDRRREILVAHSVPSTAMMGRFDPTVLMRDLTPADYEARKGAAHIMVWGRGYDAEQLEDLVERWGVNMFILGHEKAELGVKTVPPCAIILNSDHEQGVYLPIDLDHPPLGIDEAAAAVERLSQVSA